MAKYWVYSFLLTALQYFETDNPELYKTKIKFIEDNDIENMEDMELMFSEEEYNERGQLVRVSVYSIPTAYRCVQNTTGR